MARLVRIPSIIGRPRLISAAVPAAPQSPPPPRGRVADAVGEREEALLMGRIAAGDGDAVVDLYRRYERRLYALGMRLLDDPGMAEELVQETFVRAWRGAHGYAPALGSVRQWLFTIARRTGADLWRRRAAGGYVTAAPPDAGEDDRSDEILLSVDVRDALDALTRDHREILDLCVGRDLSQAQAAAHLGIPVGTVKSRTHLALRALEAELARRGIHA